MQEGGARGSSQPRNPNLTQIDYSAAQYNYGGQGHGANTTKNQSLQNQGGVEFPPGASQATQQQDMYLNAIAASKNGGGRGEGGHQRHQSAPGSGRGGESGNDNGSSAGGDQAGFADEH